MIPRCFLNKGTILVNVKYDGLYIKITNRDYKTNDIMFYILSNGRNVRHVRASHDPLRRLKYRASIEYIEHNYRWNIEDNL